MGTFKNVLLQLALLPAKLSPALRKHKEGGESLLHEKHTVVSVACLQALIRCLAIEYPV